MKHEHHKSDTHEETLLMSPHQFAEFGMGAMAYIKPVRLDDVVVYAIFAANGDQMGMAQSFDAAIGNVIGCFLEPVWVQ